MSINNLYRIGDDVYFESNFSTPYEIGRIEELKKIPSGNIETKVRCFYRRRDLPNSLLTVADKYQNTLESENNIELTVAERQQLKQKELFLSRKIDVISVKQIRGKCSVTLFNEIESYYSYLSKEDTFFYCLVYDPYVKIIQPDKGEIRVGNRYQADIPELLKDIRPEHCKLETLIWTSDHNLTDDKINQFLITSRSIGTFARALDFTNSIKQPNLYMNAAAASRDISMFHAMDTLHNSQYSIADAISALIPPTGPVLSRDQIEEWSSSEAHLFEEALETYGKKFHDIREDFLPWKSVKNIIEYYYMWKTTSRYIQHKRIKELKAEPILNEIHIPIFTKKNSENVASNKPCESCGVSSSQQWISWHPSHMQKKLCEECWIYWKKYGGFKNLSIGFDPENEDFQMDNTENSKEERMPITHIDARRRYRCSILGCGKKFKVKDQLLTHYSTSHKLSLKTRATMDKRASFYLVTTVLTKLSRRLCRELLSPRHAARSPFQYINTQAIKVSCRQKIAGKMIPELLRTFLKKTKKNRGSVTEIASKLALLCNYELIVPKCLQTINKNRISKSETLALEKSSKKKYNKLSYENNLITNNESKLLKAKSFNKVRGTECTPLNVNQLETLLSPFTVHEIPGSSNIIQNVSTNYPNGSDIIVPNDMYFKSNLFNKNVRQLIPLHQLKSVARKPWRKFYE